MTRIRALAALFLALALAQPAAAAPYERPGRTERVSLATDGTEGDGAAAFAAPELSYDGRFVVFSSAASNLVPGDENGVSDVFLRDRVEGTTERISVATDGSEAQGASGGASITPGADLVAFHSAAPNLVPGDTNGRTDVFLRDLTTGELELVSVGVDGAPANGNSTSPSISSADRFIAFTSDASNLVAGDTNGVRDVFVRHDLFSPKLTRANLTSADAQSTSAVSGTVDVAGDGSRVAFVTGGALVAADTNGRSDVYVYEVFGGDVTLRSTAYNGELARENVGTSPALNGSGMKVAFDSAAWNLVPLDTNGDIGPVFDTFMMGFDVYVSGPPGGTREASVTSAGVEPSHNSLYPDLDADGVFVTFTSGAPDVVAGDANGTADVFVHDLYTGATELVSVGGDPTGGGGYLSAISGDGGTVAFLSAANDLVADDWNGEIDVFVRDLGSRADVFELAATRTDDGIRVEGTASLVGVELASSDDPVVDAPDGTAKLGMELVQADVFYRPELDDLLVKLHPSELPSLRDPRASVGTAGAPGVVHGVKLSLGGVPYQVRVSERVPAVSPRFMNPQDGTTRLTPSSAQAWRFELFRCQGMCASVATLAGGYGTAGTDIRFAIPLDAIGADPGSTLTGLRAYSAFGDGEVEPAAEVDTIALPSVTIPATTVRVQGLADGRIAGPAVEAPLTAGRFAVTIPAGADRVSAVACLGDLCGLGTGAPVSG